jgi:archaellum component FlaF (FlaF/FlaG flagellin family)
VFEVKCDGFVGNDDEKVLISKPKAKTTATKTSDVGTYPINVTGGSADNYTFSYTSGILTINKAEQTISWEQDLSALSVDDQVELKAEASSGLPITYTVDQTNIAEIYSTGNKYYLDCKGEGTFQIVAVQNGNKNYYSSTRIRKNVTIGNSSGINEMANSQVKVQRTTYGIKVIDANVGDMIFIYTLDGLLQHSVKVDSKNVEIPLKKQDVYVIKVGGKIVKFGFK